MQICSSVCYMFRHSLRRRCPCQVVVHMCCQPAVGASTMLGVTLLWKRMQLFQLRFECSSARMPPKAGGDQLAIARARRSELAAARRNDGRAPAADPRLSIPPGAANRAGHDGSPFGQSLASAFAKMLEVAGTCRRSAPSPRASSRRRGTATTTMPSSSACRPRQSRIGVASFLA